MFHIIYNEKFYRVYSVRDNKENNLPDFLIFINSHWAWVSCIHCTPEIIDGEFNYTSEEDTAPWDYSCFKRMITTAFEKQGVKSMFIDVRNYGRKETDNVVNWAEQLGYQAKEIDTHDVRIWK